MNVKGTILHPATKPQFDSARFNVQTSGSTQISNLGSGSQTPQNHASAVKPASFNQYTGIGQTNSQVSLARMQQLQQNSSKQSYLASSGNVGHQPDYRSGASMKVLDLQHNTTHHSGGAHGNSSQLSGISMSGLSENILRQSHSKSSLQNPQPDERLKQMQLANSNYNSSYPIQSVLNSQYHEGMLNIGNSKHQQKASKSSMSTGAQQVKPVSIQNRRLAHNPDEATQKELRATGLNAIFNDYNINCQQLYDDQNKSGHASSLLSDAQSITPNKSDLNETDDLKKSRALDQRLEKLGQQRKKPNLNNNLSQSHLPSPMLAATQPIVLNSGAMKTPASKPQQNHNIQSKMEAILKSKSPEPSLHANHKPIQQRAPFSQKTLAQNYLSQQPQTIATKTPHEPLIKPGDSQRFKGGESIVCPIYPSKDFRLVNPTNSNKPQFDKDQEYSQSQLKKKAMTFVSGKDRIQRSTTGQQPTGYQNNEPDNHIENFKNYGSMIDKHRAPKAFSPEPSLNERIQFLPVQQETFAVRQRDDMNHRSSSTVSREATIEDVYMTQRAQKAIIAGKKKKHKKSIELQQTQGKLAQKIAVENYFEGTEQVEVNKALKNFEKQQKKSQLTQLEAETYLKMLSMSQLEKYIPGVNFKFKLTDSTNAAYHTKLKSKSQSGGVSIKNSANSGKKRDNSASISQTSSQPPTEQKGHKRSRIRMKSIGTEHSASQSSNKGQHKKHLRKSAISPQTPNTLQEPSAKALPTSSKVKINAKFNKLVSSGDKEKSFGEKSKAQVISSTQSKKNLFQKKTTPKSQIKKVLPQSIPQTIPQSLCLSPSNKAPAIRRSSVTSISSNNTIQNLLQPQELVKEGETRLQSKQVYGMRSGEQDHFVGKERFGSQLQMSPIAQYYNQVNNGAVADGNSKLQNSQLFSISQLRHSHQNPVLSISNELEHTTFSGPVINQSREMEAKITKKRASTVSTKGEHEQVFEKVRDDGKATIFDCDLAKNFRSISPPQRETEIKAFTDMKLTAEKGNQSRPETENQKQYQKKIFQLKRTSLSPPSNLFFSIPKEQPNDSQKVMIRMFPKHSSKISPDPKAQNKYQIQQMKQVLSGSSSTTSVIKTLAADAVQKLSSRISLQNSQKQYIAEMAINQNMMSRPTSNEVIKTFKMQKAKFLSPEIKAREVISPDQVKNIYRKASNSPDQSNTSGGRSENNKIKTIKPSQHLQKVKTNSQLGSTQQIPSFSTNAIFTKNQVEVVLNRVSQPQKNKGLSIKETVVRSSQVSQKQPRKAPTAIASIALTKPQSTAQDQIVMIQKNKQLFKKSTLQKSSVIAQVAAKKNQLRDSQELSGQTSGDRSKNTNDHAFDIDEIPIVQVLDVISQPHKRGAKQSDRQQVKKPVDYDKHNESNDKKTSKRAMIGDQVFSESQKKKPVLCHITEISDVQLTPLTKGKESFKSSVVSQIQNLTKDTGSDKEQLMFNRDVQKLMKMIRMHFRQFNQAPPTSCEFYRIGRVLGKGAFGKVNFAMHKLSEQLVAIKSMSKETLQSEDDLRRRTKLEMGILQQSNHPNVVRLFDTFETQKHICFVMELCSGGDLFSYIKKRRRLKEDVARFFFRQIIEGLAYVHNVKLVVHRDIKLENILLDATGNVKICDFGVSRQLKTEKQVMHEQCGTPAYIAPEILKDQGYNGFKVDMWSAGVCLYAMLIGSVPFKAGTMAALQELIIKGQYDLKFQTSANSNKLNNPKAASTILSEDVKDLIKRLLCVDPTKRLSAVQALEHPWLKDAPTEFDVFTDKEKTLIQKEYMRLNLKKSNHVKDSMAGKSSRHASFSQIQETEQALFTEHNLETKNADEEEPQMRNNEDKSLILAPFNSIKSMFIEQPNQPAKEKSPEPFKWPEEITSLIMPRRVIKFAKKCREKNRIYEQNNNADLDNGVYNEFVNEQEKEEGAAFKKDSDDTEEEKASPKLSKRSFSSDSRGSELMKSSSEDSLQKSFRDTELSSDDERADKQIRQTHQDWELRKDQHKLFNLMEEEKIEEIRFVDKRTPPCVPGVAQNQKPKQIGGPSAAAQKVLAYQEKEFYVDQGVVAQIEQMNVIPKAYLLQELMFGSEKKTQGEEQQPKPIRKMNYVTATYYLLVKRKELQQIQGKR